MPHRRRIVANRAAAATRRASRRLDAPSFQIERSDGAWPASTARYHPPMARRLFTLAAGVSAVLCVGVCALWGFSFRTWLRLDSVKVKQPPDPEWGRTGGVARRGGAAA